jgi:hypothetical protein
VIGEMPLLMQLETIAKQTTLRELRMIFNDWVLAGTRHRKILSHIVFAWQEPWPSLISLENMRYDFEIKDFEIFLKRKIEYQAEILKQNATISKSTVCLINVRNWDAFLKSWLNITPDIKRLDHFYKIEEPIEDPDDRSVSELIEKYVILDILYDSYITNYFIQLNRFPFDLEGYDASILKLKPEILQLIWYSTKDRYSKEVKRAVPAQESTQI